MNREPDTTTLVKSRPTILARVESSAWRSMANLALEFGAYPFAYVFSDAAGATFRTRDGREMLNFGSNNYLALATHPRVVAAARDAVERFGTGCTGSRFLNGTMQLHVSLEEELADFYGKEAALVSTTGFTANTAAVTGLGRKDDWFVCDQDIHACLLEGIATCGANVSRFRHNDVRSLKHKLALLPSDAAVMVIVEGMYSVDGSVAPLVDVIRAVEARSGALLVDEAHGLGVMGGLGRGAGEELDCLDRIDLLTVTFSKSLGSCGGAVLGPQDAVDEIRHSAHSYIFTASNVPAATAAALEALRVLRETPELPATARYHGQLVREAATAAGWPVTPGTGPIVSLPVRDVIHAALAWKLLMDDGVYCNVMIPPAVPKGKATLRLSAIVTHTPAHIERLHDALVEVMSGLQDTLSTPPLTGEARR